ncbi:hypothetical protein AB0J83_04095 [Actinoplanes sp. NPDC049596]
MHRFRAALAAAAVACTATVTAVVAGAGPATAGPPALSNGVILPIDAATDVAVDPVHKRVLISDALKGQLVSVSYFGGVQKYVPIARGVSGMAFSADYSTLYVTVADDHQIHVFDAATLDLRRTYELGQEVWPRTAIVAGGQLWFGYDGGFGSLDPATGKTTGHDLIGNRWAPELRTSPGAPGTLVVADAGPYAPGSGDVHVYDVTGGTAKLKNEGRFSDGLLNDVGFSADGKTLIGFGNSCLIWKAPIAELEKRTNAYHNGICTPHAVDVNTDGEVAFAYGNTSSTPDVAISPAGSELPAEQFAAPVTDDVNTLPDEVWDVAWEPGGERLFVLSHSASNYKGKWRFWPVHGSAAFRPTITLNAPATAVPDTDVKITGTIAVPGAHVELIRDYAQAPYDYTPMRTAIADASGRFTLIDQPTMQGRLTYTVQYQGTDKYAPSSASAVVTMRKNTPTLTVTPNNTVNAYGSTVTVTAHLGSTYSNRAVQIWADPVGSEPARLLRLTNVDAKGNLTSSLKLTRTTAIVAKFTGDEQYAAAQAVSFLHTRVALNLQPSRQYKAAKIGSVPYRFYRANVHPYFLTTMTSYPGRKQRLTIEAYSGGKWKAQRVLYLPLNSAGQSAFTLTGAHPTGVYYRVRADYITTSSGDNVNYSTASPYYYFTFTK